MPIVNPVNFASRFNPVTKGCPPVSVITISGDRFSWLFRSRFAHSAPFRSQRCNRSVGKRGNHSEMTRLFIPFHHPIRFPNATSASFQNHPPAWTRYVTGWCVIYPPTALQRACSEPHTSFRIQDDAQRITHLRRQLQATACRLVDEPRRLANHGGEC